MATLVIGTFAWDVYQDFKENKFGNALVGGSISVTEKFEDPHLEEGKTVVKEVGITNTSSSNVLVRASFEESLRILATDGTGKVLEQHLPASALNANYTSTAYTKAVPIIVDAAAYATKAATNTDETVDWADITSMITWDSGAAPADVVIYGRTTKTKVTTPGMPDTWNVKTEYFAIRKFDLTLTNLGEVSKDIVVKYPGATGHVAQEVKGDLEVDGFNSATGAYTGFKMSNVTFGFYEELKDYTANNWAGAQTYVDTIPGATDITPALAAVGHSSLDTNIEFTYHADVVNTLPISTSKWIYNEEDGYFYWTAILPSGNTTSHFLTNVGLKAGVGNEYDYLDFNLYVEGQGILANQDALDSEWAALKAAASGSRSNAIYTYLSSLL